jgi:hypothetical protein
MHPMKLRSSNRRTSDPESGMNTTPKSKESTLLPGIAGSVLAQQAGSPSQASKRKPSSSEKRSGDEPVRKSPRKSISKSAINIDYFAGPSYVKANHPWAGGKCSTATLGPAALKEMGSDSDPKKPAAIERARQEYGIRFISGHLLNAELGGDGNNSDNLTILTPTANSNHKGFDNPVKEAIRGLRKVYEILLKYKVELENVKYGIKVSIATKDIVWAENYPGNCISNGLTCTAEVVKAETVTELHSCLDDGHEVAERESNDEKMKNEVASAMKNVSDNIKKTKKEVANPRPS